MTPIPRKVGLLRIDSQLPAGSQTSRGRTAYRYAMERDMTKRHSTPRTLKVCCAQLNNQAATQPKSIFQWKHSSCHGVPVVAPFKRCSQVQKVVDGLAPPRQASKETRVQPEFVESGCTNFCQKIEKIKMVPAGTCAGSTPYFAHGHMSSCMFG